MAGQSVALALVMCLTLAVPAMATEQPMDVAGVTTMTQGTHTVYEKTQEQFAKDFENYVDGILEEITRDIHGQTKTVYGTVQTKTVQGYPGNQPVYGYSFPNSGSVYFTETGGPEIAVSFNVGIPGFSTASIGIALGNATQTASGYSCNIPASSHYYKVYETKTFQIEPWAAYWRQTSFDPWELAWSGEYVDIMSVRAEPIMTK